jgi:acyl-CoA thioesterase-1
MRIFVILAVAILFLGCSDKQNSNSQPSSSPGAPAKQRPKIVAFGDSLTAGLGLTAKETYPAQLQSMLDSAGYDYEVVNAGVSGDTSAGGLRRMDWVLDENVKFVVLELGANDILRGLPILLMKQNLAKMIESMQSRGITVVLAGMEAPTNSGPEYRKEVHEAYRALASQYKTLFIPFFLEGVVQSEKLIQEDLSHPNPEGAKVLASTVFKALRPSLKSSTTKY